MVTQPAASVAPPAEAPARKPRIVGVDTARGLAIIGMFIAHLGLEKSTDFFSTTGWFWIADGRSSALFATLAGTGLAFMTMKAYATGDPAEYAVQRVRLVKRSAILWVLGWILTLLGTPVAVILGSYAALFVLALPFLRLRPIALLAWAGGVALVMPTLVLVTRDALLGGTTPDTYDGGAILAVIVPVVGELWAGYYPALSWVLYLLVGLAVGRMPLRRWSTQVGLLVVGAVVAAAGYVPGLALEQTTSGLAQDLVTIEPHSNTTFEMVGNVGIAVAVLGLCLLLTSWVAPLRILLIPVSAMGSMSLTVYSAQIVYIAILGEDAVWNATSNWPLIWLIVGSMAFATIWQLTLGQGPLERLMHAMIRPRPPQQPPGPPTWPIPQQPAAGQQPWPPPPPRSPVETTYPPAPPPR